MLKTNVINDVTVPTPDGEAMSPERRAYLLSLTETGRAFLVSPSVIHMSGMPPSVIHMSGTNDDRQELRVEPPEQEVLRLAHEHEVVLHKVAYELRWARTICTTIAILLCVGSYLVLQGTWAFVLVTAIFIVVDMCFLAGTYASWSNYKDQAQSLVTRINNVRGLT